MSVHTQMRLLDVLPQRRRYVLLVISLFFLNVFLWLPLVELAYGVPVLLKYGISLFFISSLVIYRIKNEQRSRRYWVVNFVIAFFCFWSGWLLLTSFRYEVFYFQEVFAARYFFIPFLIPLLVLNTEFSLGFFKVLLRCASILVLIAVLVQIALIVSGLDRNVWYESVHRMWIFDLGCSLLLLTSHLFRRKLVSVSVLIYFILLVFISASFGSRSILLESVLFLLFALYLRFNSEMSRSFDKFKLFLICIVVVVSGAASITYLQKELFVFEKGFDKESFENSRGRVLEDFFSDFTTREDWVFGRGLNGTVLRTIRKGSKYGNVIENGFLYIILKGGLLYLLPMITLFLWAFYLGFFRSNNDFSKALAVLPLVYVLVMFAFNLPDYSSKYVIVWIAVSVNLSKSFRRLSNEAVYILFNYDVKRRFVNAPSLDRSNFILL